MSAPDTSLTPTMQAAYQHAKAHGSVLERFPGGYWCEVGRTQWTAHGGQTFSTPTVQALVSRGLADYTEWKDGRNGRFPIRATLTGAEL